MINKIEISVFMLILTTRLFFRFNEFGTDGGPAAKELLPKLNTFKSNVSARFGFDLPVIDVSFGSSVD